MTTSSRRQPTSCHLGDVPVMSDNIPATAKSPTAPHRPPTLPPTAQKSIQTKSLFIGACFSVISNETLAFLVAAFVWLIFFFEFFLLGRHRRDVLLGFHFKS